MCGKIAMRLSVIFSLLFAVGSLLPVSVAGASEKEEKKDEQVAVATEGQVIIVDMEMMILPGTQGYLEKAIVQAEQSDTKLIIVKLNTPGGILHTTQKMIQRIFQSEVPVVIYVSPAGGTATSAGVFITMAGHIAAMAPGTSIGAAHPVTGEGKDIEGDMRKKAENMTIKMVQSITEVRGRNAEWAQKAVKESSSLTEKEAIKKGVVDLVASDVGDLLKKVAGRKVTLEGDVEQTLADYSALKRVTLDMTFTDEMINVLANPNIAALLWLAATTGISLELYNPGAIVPGVVGIICLIMALAVSQVIPITQGGIALLSVGALLIGAELYIGSGILGVGGLIAMILGAVYLIDVTQAPDLAVTVELIGPLALLLGGFLLAAVYTARKARLQKALTGKEGLVGKKAVAESTISESGKVFIDGEIWNATTADGLIDKGVEVEIVKVLPGLKLEVVKLVK